METYHLYAVRAEDIRTNERFYLITPSFALLYTANRPPKKHREILRLKGMPDYVMAWLGEAINQLREEDLAENEELLLRRANGFYKCFERELRAEQEKLDAAKGVETVAGESE